MARRLWLPAICHSFKAKPIIQGDHLNCSQTKSVSGKRKNKITQPSLNVCYISEHGRGLWFSMPTVQPTWKVNTTRVFPMGDSQGSHILHACENTCNCLQADTLWAICPRNCVEHTYMQSIFGRSRISIVKTELTFNRKLWEANVDRSKGDGKLPASQQRWREHSEWL